MSTILIDGGFNKGEYTRKYLQQNPDVDKIYAFEPMPGLFNPEDLPGMVPAGRKCEIITMQAAMWIVDGFIDMRVSTRPDGHSLMDNMRTGTGELKQVPCLDFSMWWSKFIVPCVAAGSRVHMKLDIEGAEYAVLGRMLDMKQLPADSVELRVEFHARNFPRSYRAAMHAVLVARMAHHGVKYTLWK
jgi:FkbM family methyltransferase